MFQTLIQKVLQSKDQYSNELKYIDNVMAKFAEQLVRHEMWSSYINSPGKRIRAILALNIMHKLGENSNQILELLAYIELLHFGALMHDDVMDQNLVRRGKSSFFNTYGAKFAILGGDLVLVALFQKLVNMNNSQTILKLFVETSRKVVHGAILEQFLTTNSSLTKYLKAAALKTASLFALAASMASSHCPDEVLRRNIEKQSMCFGILFQIQNDLDEYNLKTWDTSEDFKQNLATFPTILLPNFKFEYTKYCFEQVQAFINTTDFLASCQNMLATIYSCAECLVEGA